MVFQMSDMSPLFLCFLQSTVNIVDGKMVHVQKWDDKETTLVREVSDKSLTLVSAPTWCFTICRHVPGCIVSNSLCRHSHLEKSSARAIMKRHSKNPIPKPPASAYVSPPMVLTQQRPCIKTNCPLIAAHSLSWPLLTSPLTVKSLICLSLKNLLKIALCKVPPNWKKINAFVWHLPAA